MQKEINTRQLDVEKEKRIAVVVYALQLASVVFGITLLIAVIINYIKKEDVQGTWLESHFRWQIRTFWYGLLWGIIGMITSFIFIGTIILIIAYIWVLYRAIKGLISISDKKEMYA